MGIKMTLALAQANIGKVQEREKQTKLGKE